MKTTAFFGNALNSSGWKDKVLRENSTLEAGDIVDKFLLLFVQDLILRESFGNIWLVYCNCSWEYLTISDNL